MDLTSLTQSLQTALGGHLPTILGAVGIGLIGWIAAIIVRSVAKRGFTAIGLDGKVNKAAGTQWPVTNSVATGLYALILLMTAIAVLNALNLGGASGPLSTLATEVLAFLPKLVAGVVLAGVAWVVATLVRSVLSRVLAATSLDSRMSTSTVSSGSTTSQAKAATPLSGQLAHAGFWFTLLMFLPAVLDALKLDGLLSPVQGMMSNLLGIVPNMLAAAAIGVVGYLVATLLRAIVTNLLEAAGANRASQTLGLSNSLKLSSLAGTVVYVLVLIPTMIAALDALKIEAISAPATAMLGQVFELIPNLIAAAVILGVTYFVARIVAGLATEFLAGIGFDTLPGKLGLTNNPNTLKPSVVAGKALMFFAMLFAATEAANRLGFSQVSELSATFIKFGGDLLLGGFILTIGFWLANLTHDAIQRAAGEAKSPIAKIARFAILGLVLAMGLRAMGIAADIVNLAFGLTLGAVAVAGALSFGLGGREAAGRQMEYWLSGWRNPSRNVDPNAVPLPGDTPVREGIFTPPKAQAAKENGESSSPN